MCLWINSTLPDDGFNESFKAPTLHFLYIKKHHFNAKLPMLDCIKWASAFTLWKVHANGQHKQRQPTFHALSFQHQWTTTTQDSYTTQIELPFPFPFPIKVSSTSLSGCVKTITPIGKYMLSNSSFTAFTAYYIYQTLQVHIKV